MKKSNTLIKYIIEGSIVFLSVFLSFYITDVNREKNMKERKNILLKDLSNSMIQDTLQIYSYIAEKEIILKSWKFIVPLKAYEGESKKMERDRKLHETYIKRYYIMIGMIFILLVISAMSAKY